MDPKMSIIMRFQYKYNAPSVSNIHSFFVIHVPTANISWQKSFVCQRSMILVFNPS